MTVSPLVRWATSVAVNRMLNTTPKTAQVETEMLTGFFRDADAHGVAAGEYAREEVAKAVFLRSHLN